MNLRKESKDLAATMLMLFFGFVYFTTYLVKKSYAVVIPAILDAGTGLSKDQLSIPLTCLFVCYGVCQIFAGLLCDKVKNPKIITSVALGISALCNFAVPFSFSNVAIMSVVWAINGLAQSFVWPSLIRICSFSFNEKQLPGATTAVVIGGYIGQCALYLLAFLFIRTVGFQSMFYLTGAIALTMAIINFFIVKKEQSVQVQRNEAKSSFKRNIFFVFILIIVVIVLCGALRDSLETWTPTYIKEAFSLGSDLSIIGSIIMPILSIAFAELSLVLYKKMFKNPIKLSLAFFVLCLACIFVLFLSKNSNAILSLVLMSLSYGLMCATNHCLISYVPIYYKDTGKMSSIASILNGFTYAGSALATYLIGYISKDDVFGWNGAIVAWIVLAVASIVITAVVMVPWNKEHHGLPKE